MLIFFLDISKQGFTSLLAHFMNLMYSVILSEGEKHKNPCDWYFVNIVIDTTIGVLCCYFLLQLANKAAKKWRFNRLISGVYIVYSNIDVV